MPAIGFTLDLIGSITLSNSEVASLFLWDVVARKSQLWILTDSSEPPFVTLADDDNPQGVITSIEAFGKPDIPIGLGVKSGVVFSLRANVQPTSGITINVWQRGGRRVELKKPSSILLAKRIADEPQEPGQSYA